MTREIRIHLRPETCRACRTCLAADECKVRAIMRIDDDEPPYIDIERCYDCRLCVPACPFGALGVLSDIRLSINTMR
ncbi:MAG: 4Fe-4S dicluster domain-containing protein [Chloroflexi bacterium]|nr:4Fe-4S dicluster domain-containing protein [Chloroflexota bacterium]